MNREDWLNEAARRFCKDFLFHEDLDVHVSVGWPSRGGLSTKKRTIGECWKPETSKDGKSHVFISPMLVEPTVVLATLLHEMIHAFDRCESGHKGLFIEMARKVGLEKPWTATTAGFDLQQRLSILADDLGAYPHVSLEPLAVQRKVQTTRQLKVVCPECEYTARITKKWIEVGLPTCPCGTQMEQEVKPDDVE